jgi:isopentenyl diphosphate isomerase/L-lactate dehydrogenase-like FMN-dependent dehydrogenase
MPRVVFDYIDGGAEREVTLKENCRAYDDVLLRPRSAVATRQVDLATTVLGTTIDLPFMLAPVGSSRLFWPRGEQEAARAAGEAGTGYILSTLSGSRLEDVRAATRGPAWYQLYLVGGRNVALSTIARAKAAGYRALVVTIDTPVAGLRERDFRNGIKELLSRRPLQVLPYLPQLLSRPRWLAGYFGDGGLMKFPNIVLEGGPMPYADVGAALEQSMVSWDDFPWIREAWGGSIVVKGVHTEDDARRRIGRGRVQSRRAAARRGRADHSSAAGSGGGGGRADRSTARRRHPQRQRRGEGAVPRRARRVDRACLRLRTGRGRWRRRCARHRHPAHRHRADAEAARLWLGARAGRFVRRRAHRVETSKDSVH